MKTMDDVLYFKLKQALEPSILEVINESHLHQGHAGDDGSGETHYKLKVASKLFEGKSRIECHRMIHGALRDELKERVHALSIIIMPS